MGLNQNDTIELLYLCFSESSLNYSANHQGRYTHVCGVDPIWKPYLSERNIPYNTLQAGWEVYMYYYYKNNQDRLKAILEFKGVEHNKKVKEISKKIIKATNKVKTKEDLK